uniref:Uncharacterized protein n=1 Tax=Globodera rostochiensis TaxID=31243 RepID=A0A914HR92_GLORO
MSILPTNYPWVLVENCVCPTLDNFCYRPGPYKSPVICANASVKNITDFLASPLENCPFSTGSTTVIILQMITILILIALSVYLLATGKGRTYILGPTFANLHCSLYARHHSILHFSLIWDQPLAKQI